ncbi:MAG: DegV family protein [Chloroflexi bacterium]|nr:DegV family protein [Chloroflexota bacterium]
MTIFGKLRRFLPTRQAAAPERRSVSVVRVVTDSTADLSPEQAQELGITVVPMQVIFGEESFRDGIDLTSDEFFRRLKESDELPHTSQPSVGDFQETYERLAAETEQILSIHLSAGFSGTVDTARQAAQALIGRCSIEVIDSRTVSMAMGFAVIAAARAAREGAGLEACAEAARGTIQRGQLALALDTLEYLRRGGRIGRAQAFLGSVLRLKPILTIRDGGAHPLTRVRTRRKALDELLRLCLEQNDVVEAAVMHTTTPDDARHLAEEIERRCGIAVHIGRIGPVLSVHGGPGTIGIAVVLAEEPQPAGETKEAG